MNKKRKTKVREERVKISTGSVYDDLGYKDPDEMKTKANLVVEIGKAIKNKDLNPTNAAKILGISQPKLSELLRGRFRGYSVERLMHFLNELGKDIDIVVKSKPDSRKARVNVYHSNGEGPTNIPMAAKGKN